MGRKSDQPFCTGGEPSLCVASLRQLSIEAYVPFASHLLHHHGRVVTGQSDSVAGEDQVGWRGRIREGTDGYVQYSKIRGVVRTLRGSPVFLRASASFVHALHLLLSHVVCAVV